MQMWSNYVDWLHKVLNLFMFKIVSDLSETFISRQMPFLNSIEE